MAFGITRFSYSFFNIEVFFMWLYFSFPGMVDLTNTQGGVGKTTLTYHLSTNYAEEHPEERVLVIDMCPQANISSALLGE